MYRHWLTFAVLALGLLMLSCAIGPSSGVPPTTVRIDNLTLDELDKQLEEQGIPKGERNRIIQEERERRENKGCDPNQPCTDTVNATSTPLLP